MDPKRSKSPEELLQSMQELPEELENQMRFRMSHGISREQAVLGVKLQLENDARILSEERAAETKAKGASRTGENTNPTK